MTSEMERKTTPTTLDLVTKSESLVADSMYTSNTNSPECSASTSDTDATLLMLDGTAIHDRPSLKGARPYSEKQRHEVRELQALTGSKTHVMLDGKNLSIPSLVATARFGVPAQVKKSVELCGKVQASVDFLKQELKSGQSIYGITTGFGGSADTSTDQFQDLQMALIQMQVSGILPESPLSYEAGLACMSMPEAWVRGAMIVRINSLVRGHSAVRMKVIDSLIKLIELNIVPFVPLHGSISASGDLSPLSYIAATLEGNPDVYAWTGNRELVPSDEALAYHNLSPIVLGPKEGLGILNGTAFSTAVAGLALHDVNNLAILSQVLTAMGVEALMGSAESFEPFIATVRPHKGQGEVAANIAYALKGSKLVQDSELGKLRQDRYSLRTASQWLGPGLEDLMLATEQLEQELNSTTDNPLIEPESKRTFHGGNFQAVSVTSSTEKTRLALQMLGKLIFAQSAELLDVKMNNGLPPNLAFDEPSLSYTLKGVDINMAAYMAELGFLTNPVSSHVQSAEMGNQSLNSMALVSARYTHKAVDMVSLMASAYLYSLCQALDLRAFQEAYLEALRPEFERLCEKHLSLSEDQWRRIWKEFKAALPLTITADSQTRFEQAVKHVQPALLDLSVADPLWTNTSTLSLETIKDWSSEVATVAGEIFRKTRVLYSADPDASHLLGSAAREMYTFVRKELGVPIHKGLVDYPTKRNGGKERSLNVGTWISKIHCAVRDGRVAGVVVKCF